MFELMEGVRIGRSDEELVIARSGRPSQRQAELLAHPVGRSSDGADDGGDEGRRILSVAPLRPTWKPRDSSADAKAAGSPL